ncbi:MAG: hypothetical protein GY839_02405, partial [candidate division Zixibacteria bacterium]|nr:hypothetical protein [candidate division Zixibacteria bacterium]
MIKFISCIILLLLIANIGLAQVEDTTYVEPPDTAQSYSGPDETVIKPKPKKSPARLSGDFGLYGEFYSVSDGDARRPSETGRLFLRPTLTLFGTFSASLDIIYSTEGSSAKQDINQFAVHPKWSWGTLHAGDFSHELSKYTMSGLNIRGAGVELYPGMLRFHAVGGQSKRKVEAGAYSSVYSQNAYGIKLGIGQEDKSYFDINFVRVKDNQNSLPVEIFQVDSIEVDTTLTPDSTDTEQVPQNGITPEENMAVSASTALKLFNRQLVFRGEFAGSAYTRNLYSTSEIGEDIPSIVSNIYTPRTSSNFDYAYATELSYNQRVFNIRGGYTLIGPGYTSLGMTSNINDKQTLEGGLGFRLLRNKVALQGTFQNQSDNVADQKTNTTTRTTIGVNAIIRPVNQISIALNTMQNVMKNDAADDSTWIVQDSIWNEQDSSWTEPDSVLYVGQIHNVNSSYSANIMYQFMMFNMNQSLNANFSMQLSEDKNPARLRNDINTRNIMFAFMSMLSRSWSATANVSLNTVDLESQDKTSRTGLGLT